MWKFDFRRVTKALSACTAFLFGMLILQGCGRDAPNPYAALDKAYPDGRPAASTPEERTQDRAYSARLAEMGKKTPILSSALEEARGRLENYIAQYRKDMTRRMGEAPTEDIFRAELETRGAYRQLVKNVTDAQTALDTHSVAIREFIGERMTAERDRYDAMRRQADADAAAAGLPVRGAREVDAAAVAAAQEADRLRAEELRRRLRPSVPPQLPVKQSTPKGTPSGNGP